MSGPPDLRLIPQDAAGRLFDVLLAIFALVFVVLPLAEIAVAIQVSHWIGVADTLGLILLFSVVGAWLAWHIGFSVLRKMRYSLAQGVVPTNDLIDAALVFSGGVLLFLPGFITDAVGLLLLFPPTRHVARNLLKRRFRTRVYRYGISATGNVIDV
jgi:UPF0716 protein FxsA